MIIIVMCRVLTYPEFTVLVPLIRAILFDLSRELPEFLLGNLSERNVCDVEHALVLVEYAR